VVSGRQPEGYTAAAVAAIGAAHAAGLDLAGWLAGVLCQAAAQVGGIEALLAARPGSWEAELVRQLVYGTWGAELGDGL
jgi:hypothetical protein